MRTTRVMHHVVSCPCRSLGSRQCACSEPVTASIPQYMINSNFLTPHPTASPGQLAASRTSPDSKSDASSIWRCRLAPTRKAIAGGSYSPNNSTLTSKLLAVSGETNSKPMPFLRARDTRASTAHSIPLFLTLEVH